MSTDATYNFTTNFTSAGNYVVTLDITDSFSDRSERYRNDLNYSWIVIVNDADQTIIVTDIQPTPGAISIFEMEYINFFIEAHDPDGNPLEYSWKLDGIEVSTTIMYFFSTDYTMSGLYLVTLDVTDNFTDNSLYFEWNVEVIDVDQPIVVTNLSYATYNGSVWIPDDQIINESEGLIFTITATDPDGNPLEYSWKLDGVEVSSESTYGFTTDYTSAGTYTVTLDLTDNFGVMETVIRENRSTDNILIYTWNVEVIDVDQPIVVTEILPAPGTLIINEMDIINFSFDGYDPDGNDLVYSWKLDGIEVSTTNTYDFVTDYTSAGTYDVTLDVTDNFGTRRTSSTSRDVLYFEWSVEVIDVDQEIVIAEIYPEPGAVIISEGDSIYFDITAYDPDGNDLEYSWQVDEVEVSTNHDFMFYTNYTSAGEYTVTLDLTDNFGTRRTSFSSRNTLFFEWAVEVIDVDQLIVVDELIPPEGNIIIDEEVTINFSIDAYDPDGNSLEYSWQLDGEEVSTSDSYDFVTDWQSAGDYVITLDVTDNFGTRDNLNFLWNVHVNDTVSSPSALIPIISKLFANYPNPFNPVTTIQLDIKENESGILTIYNIKGQLIESNKFESGQHNYIWDATGQSSGLYFYKLQTESITEARKMLLLK